MKIPSCRIWSILRRIHRRVSSHIIHATKYLLYFYYTEKILEKMTYMPQEGKVLYGDARDMKVYDALDFPALLSCHITGRWERRVVAYGYCLPPIFQGSLLPPGGSNKSRGMRKKQEIAGEPQVIEPVLYPKGITNAQIIDLALVHPQRLTGKDGRNGFRKSGVRIRFCVQSAEKKWGTKFLPGEFFSGKISE
ncbi:MAG: hypothetical protein RDV48_11695 [Candidatus Eremiobacteraeota bacterium]|nr:hypothetical protein [Candidatus Eremiobacteraeota bacterium]